MLMRQNQVLIRAVDIAPSTAAEVLMHQNQVFRVHVAPHLPLGWITTLLDGIIMVNRMMQGFNKRIAEKRMSDVRNKVQPKCFR